MANWKSMAKSASFIRNMFMESRSTHLSNQEANRIARRILLFHVTGHLQLDEEPLRESYLKCVIYL